MRPVRIYDNDVFPSKHIYDKLPHKKLEFWHKNMHLHGLEIECAHLKMHETDLSFYSYSSAVGANSKKYKNFYSMKGGKCKIGLAKSSHNAEIIQNLKENLEIARQNTCLIDVVLRNISSGNMLQLNMISGLNFLNLNNEQEKDFFEIYFLAIRIWAKA